jgi:thermostable 8-oxoguanine DNA glycosylase
MINPSEVTNFNRSDYELEEFFLFCIFVAGKTATTTARNLAAFLQNATLTPLNHLRFLSQNNLIQQELVRARIGQYKRLTICLTQVVEKNLDLRTCSVADLESISGIGAKTARYFLLHTRPNQNIAALDIHIMRWLKEQGFDAPARPKNNKDYLYWESIFLTEAKKYNMSIADLDLAIWNSRSKSGTGVNIGV